VLEFAASLPQHFKVFGWSTKRLLKAALAESVPSEILTRKKTGFPVPYQNWIRKELKDFFADTITAPGNFLRSYFKKEQLVKLFQMQNQGANRSKELFCLLVLELWHREFLSKTH